MKLAEQIGEETQKNLLKATLENIAKELSPRYNGKLVVKEEEEESPDTYSYVPFSSHNPFLYIAEINEIKWKLFGIFPMTNENENIILVMDPAIKGTGLGKRIMDACIVDFNAENIIRKYLEQYAEKYNLTELIIQKGF